MDLLNASLVDAAEAIQSRRISSEQLVRSAIERIERIDGELHAFISFEPDQAIAAARNADVELATGRKRGPLHGVPLAHKDMFDRVGRRATYGASGQNRAATKSAFVLQRLEAAGAISLGTLNMSEFAANPTGLNETHGDCRNPWDLKCISGGSSSGSASAVASRCVYAALGSDTGGSVRLPAAFCGVVGLKPTNGLVSRQGAMPRAWSLDAIGPLARTVRDCARVLGVVAGHDPNDHTTSNSKGRPYEEMLDQPLAGLRLGYDDSGTTNNDEIDRLLQDSRREFERFGVELVPMNLPDLRPHYLAAELINKCEAATIHRERIRENPNQYSSETRRRIEAGFYIPASCYIDAIRLRSKMLAAFVSDVFDRVDILHAPVVPFVAPAIDKAKLGDGGEFLRKLADFTHFNRPINYLGLPALTVPCGFAAGELPVAYQLIGRPFAEALLLRFGHAYQCATTWHVRIPHIIEDLSLTGTAGHA
jgi:aspartyl-tRNA(Asn)/glutamyl-tRNA(Gln) amidotransferase subunit A